jgi:hypothetical protein
LADKVSLSAAFFLRAGGRFQGLNKAGLFMVIVPLFARDAGKLKKAHKHSNRAQVNLSSVPLKERGGNFSASSQR